MAAAYAALVSLTHLIEHSLVYNARQPIFLDQQQRQLESLQQMVSLLQDFLEVYSHRSINEARDLESRIADAAYAAEDIIESYVVDKISMENSSNHFSQDLQNVIDNIDCIEKEVMAVKEKSRVEEQQPRDQVPVVLSSPLPSEKDTTLEYYNDDLEKIMDMLTGQSPNLQIIPIVGMGGIGKTTLARNVYEHPLILECFYVRAWFTVSQEYDLQKILSGLMNEIRVSYNNREQESSEYHQLGQNLHKHLSGRKYLIVIDDIWSIDVLEKVKLFLPEYNNGSRVIVTTRLSDVADSSGSSHLYKMSLLDENKSWSLLCRKVFGLHGNCPQELEEVGKDIAKNCKGLPLSIVVIGGLLAKSEVTRRYWESVAKDINQIVISEDNGRWLKILSLSYSNLPIYLKPCFLYMGVYREDYEIYVFHLIKLWVAEGFLKPNKAKSLEEVAEDYLNDLIERNLIMVCKWGSMGKVKTCIIHDLLRDLCVREAQKASFFRVVKVRNHAQSLNNERRIVFRDDWSHDIDSHEFHRALQSTPSIRSLTCDFAQHSSSWESAHNLRLLRVLNGARSPSPKCILQLVNLRILRCSLYSGASAIFSSINQLWYLQILILEGHENGIVAPKEIWEMPQLRHIIMHELCLADPSPGQMNEHEADVFVLKHLQTLLCIMNFKCTEDILRRIPNIKKLSILNQETGTYCLQNLGRLHKLQSLTCCFSRDTDFFQNLAFPQSLKKLTLCLCKFDWDDITIKVGSLPHLEKLKLDTCYAGAKWNTVEGKFLRLKYLEIRNSKNLVCWTAESSHFPLLQRLVLKLLLRLMEIPSGIGDTLHSIELVRCKSSVVDSANDILEEQQSLGNEGLRLTVREDIDLDARTFEFLGIILT